MVFVCLARKDSEADNDIRSNTPLRPANRLKRGEVLDISQLMEVIHINKPIRRPF